MKTICGAQRMRPKQSAFTLVEVMVASALAGIMFSALLAGFTMAFQTIELDRENSRATQIMLEKTEVLRLYNWDRLTGTDTNTYIPTNFSAPFYPSGNNGGFTYAGTVVITNVPIASTYSNSLKAVTINLTWTSGKAARSRSMTTWVSRYGLQNYIY
jgi:prepilin-type N-terminal cleavage/methylation domain-containing protein